MTYKKKLAAMVYPLEEMRAEILSFKTKAKQIHDDELCDFDSNTEEWQQDNGIEADNLEEIENLSIYFEHIISDLECALDIITKTTKP